MAINDFTDIPGLLFYANGIGGAESTINKTGNDITSVVSVKGSESVTFTPQGGGALHDGTTMVGLVPAFYTTSSGSFGLVGTLASVDCTTLTLATLEQYTSTPGSTLYPFVLNNGTSTLSGFRATSSLYTMRINSSSITPTDAQPTNTSANVQIMRHTGSTGEAVLYLNGTAYPAASGGAGGGIANNATILAQNGGTSINGKVAIVVAYNRTLNDTEIADLNTLIEYWRDNGEAPGGVAPPTSGTFGPPVQTDNNAVVESWQWQESSDGIAWANVGTILTDTTGATTQQLTVNSAPIEANGTQVKCVATYDTDKTVDSNTATLTVQAAS